MYFSNLIIFQIEFRNTKLQSTDPVSLYQFGGIKLQESYSNECMRNKNQKCTFFLLGSYTFYLERTVWRLDSMTNVQIHSQKYATYVSPSSACNIFKIRSHAASLSIEYSKNYFRETRSGSSSTWKLIFWKPFLLLLES